MEDEVLDLQEGELQVDEENNEVHDLGMHGNEVVDGVIVEANEEDNEFADLEVVIGLLAAAAAVGVGEDQAGDMATEQ